MRKKDELQDLCELLNRATAPLRAREHDRRGAPSLGDKCAA